MSTGLRNLLSLPAAGKTGNEKNSSDAKDSFRKQFADTMKRVNESLRLAAAHAPETEHQKAVSQRDSLISAYHSFVKRLDSGQASANDGDSKRILSAADKLGSNSTKLAQEADTKRQQWFEREEEFDDAVAKVAELRDAGHPKSSALQKLVDSIKAQTYERRFDDAVTTFEQFAPKLTLIHEQSAGTGNLVASPLVEKQALKSIMAVIMKLEPVRKHHDDRGSAYTAKKIAKVIEKLQEEKKAIEDHKLNADTVKDIHSITSTISKDLDEPANPQSIANLFESLAKIRKWGGAARISHKDARKFFGHLNPKWLAELEKAEGDAEEEAKMKAKVEKAVSNLEANAAKVADLMDVSADALTSANRTADGEKVRKMATSVTKQFESAIEVGKRLASPGFTLGAALKVDPVPKVPLAGKMLTPLQTVNVLYNVGTGAVNIVAAVARGDGAAAAKSLGMTIGQIGLTYLGPVVPAFIAGLYLAELIARVVAADSKPTPATRTIDAQGKYPNEIVQEWLKYMDKDILRYKLIGKGNNPDSPYVVWKVYNPDWPEPRGRTAVCANDERLAYLYATSHPDDWPYLPLEI